jgi:hypothetical protein
VSDARLEGGITLSQLVFGAGEADLKSFNYAEPARVLRLRGDSYCTPRMWPVYGRQAAPEHGGHMVTYPVLRRRIRAE